MFELIVIVALVAGAFYWQEQDRRKFERELRDAEARGRGEDC